MRIGIIGLPQVGKTTLFNLLTEAGASTGFGSRIKQTLELQTYQMSVSTIFLPFISRGRPPTPR